MNDVFFLMISKSLFPPEEVKAGSGTFQSIISPPKLDKGTHTYPFSFILPHTYKPVSKHEAETSPIPLPPSFNQKGFPERLDYDVFVVVQRGHLQTDDV